MGAKAYIYSIDLGWELRRIGIIEGVEDRLLPEDVAYVYKRFSDKGIIAGYPGRVDPCQAVLALIYSLEDEETGNTHIRNRALRWIATLIGARQARDAVNFIRNVESVLVAGLSVDTETLISDVLRSMGYKTKLYGPVRYDCSPDSLVKITMKRITLI